MKVMAHGREKCVTDLLHSPTSEKSNKKEAISVRQAESSAYREMADIYRVTRD